MTTAVIIDLVPIVRELGFPVDRVQRTLELLDDGNTIPFITRFRKDQTGGLNEEQVQRIQREVSKERLLADRKQTILRSIESQGRSTPELAAQVQSARTLKWLEDVYLPFKPKKQTLATQARERGLAPLANQILTADPAAADPAARAEEFIHPEKGLNSVGEVLQAVRHILAEQFSERPDIRGRLRKMMRRSGVLTSVRIESAERGPAPPEPAATEPAATEPAATEPAATEPVATEPAATEPAATEPVATEPVATEPVATEPVAIPAPAASDVTAPAVTKAAADLTATDVTATDATISREVERLNEPLRAHPTEHPGGPALRPETVGAVGVARADATAGPPSSDQPSSDQPSSDQPGSDQPGAAVGTENSQESDSAEARVRRAGPLRQPLEKRQPLDKRHALDKKPALDKRQLRKRAAKERKRKLFEHAFKDYYQFREPISRLPPHRVLALNRGERAKVLRVRVECKLDDLLQEAMRLTIVDAHPHAGLLSECVRDALQRLVIPSLERELRRELTEEAEEHAVKVFAGNLRKLLLQPPVRGRHVMAIDPAFRSGCKLVAMDQFGNVLEHASIHVIGSEEQRGPSRSILADVIRRNNIGLVAIGNGTACRETEQFVSDLLANELKDLAIAYVIVNEAGASVYSTSQIGREELPHCDAVMRSAVSIGRRLLDPLSELVKINPANIGVGMYQHDVKAKHLRDSLDGVVNSCVNFVGVDVNTASPSLLSYVSGLNQLTARRLFDYRREHGPFRNREQIKCVPGIGEATFVQAAGFLKITLGDNPLDATWIHPESYPTAYRVLDKLDIPLSELLPIASTVAGSETAGHPVVRTAVEGPAVAASHHPVERETIERETIERETIERETIERETIEGAAIEGAAIEGAAIEGAAIEGAAVDATHHPPPATLDRVEGSVLTRSMADDGSGPGNLVGQGGGERAAELRESESCPAVIAAPVGELAPPTAESAVLGECQRSLAETPSPPGVPVASRDTSSPRPALVDRLANVAVAELSRELEIGELTLRDILAALSRPGRDPRDDFSPPPFRTGIMKLDDLKTGMELQGTVLNVVDFGAFVDIGISDSALIHISKLADRYIRDPQEVVSVGDTLKVWVLDVDRQRRRVSLTAMDPHAPPRARPPRERSPQERKPRPAKAPPAAAVHVAPPAAAPPRARFSKPAFPPRHKVPPLKKPPKPVRPITPAMLSGKQPMRSFSDLAQFYEKKKQDGDEPESQ